MKLYSKIFFFLFLLALSIHAFSQAGKPVTVAVSLSPPYSPFLNEYASSGTNRLQVTIIVNDSRMMNYPAKLQMFLQRVNSGVVMRSAEFAAIPPILLNGGNTEIISGASLSPYFMAMNNVFSGFDQAQYTQTGRIPDGQYRIGFRVVDAQRTDVELSNLTFSPPGWYLLNDPPQLNFPLHQSSEKVKDIQQVKFEWFPRHLGSMNPVFAATYQLELFAMRVPGMDINQVALSTLPTYTVTTNQNHFNLMQQHFLLESGVEYAWRVRAMAADGFTLFQNQGYSEVFSFVYGSLCPVPKNIGANVMGTESARVYWDTDPMQTDFEMHIRKQGAENAVWQNYKTTEAGVDIEKMLESGTTYEYQVKAQCLNTESEFSPLKKFTTRQFEPTSYFNCDKSNTEVEINNFNPKTNLRTGEIIYNGKFPVKLTEIQGSMGTFSGKGRMRVPMLANVLVNMQFTDIKVNELNQVYDGEMVSLYNADSKFFIDDASDYFLEGNQVGNIISGQDSAAIKLNYEVGDGTLTVQINENDVTINGPGGTAVFTVDDAKNGTTVEDSKGNLYAVDGQGNVTKIGTSAGDVSANDYNTTAAAYNQLSNEWTVTFANNGTWAFDERKSAYANSPFDKEYEKIGDYTVPWKFIPLGKSDKIKASFSKGKIDDHEKLKFLTPTGTEFKSDYKDGEYYIEAVGAKERDGIELYAIYMPDKNTKIPVGKLKIASYPRLEFNVKLVPMAENNLDVKEIQKQLNEIYKPYYINWIATLDDVFEDKSWDENTEGLQATGSEFWSEYTDEMRALNAAYEEQRGLDDETLYLFVFPDGNEENNLMGDMPLESRFGYLFNAKKSNAEKLAATMAHELGHGAFQLKHTFSDKYGIKPSKTQNLMDYNNGHELVKYQWDAIHDPQNRLFNWMQGESEGMLSLYCMVFFDECDEVEGLLKKIKQYHYEEKKVLIKASSDSRRIQIKAQDIEIGGIEYKQIRIIYSPMKGIDFTFDPKNYIDFQFGFDEKRQFGIAFLREKSVIFKILIDDEDDEELKRNALKEYLFGIKTTSINSDSAVYKEIDKKVFGDLKVNEETEFVIGESMYQNEEGKFLRQNSSLGTGEKCECKCSSKKYTDSNPNEWNYLFNKIIYHPKSKIISLKNNAKEVEVEVFSKYDVGFQTTLTQTKELITFEKSRLKEAIYEIDRRLVREIPVIIGVTYGAKKGPYNKPANTTDHYMVIVSKGRDSKGVYFRYIDPAIAKGDNEYLKLHISENLIISGKCINYRLGDTYYLVELLLEKKIINCSVDPEVDNLIMEMIKKYAKDKNYYFNESTQSFKK